MKYMSYGVMVYMLAALTWWTILLTKYNTEVYMLKVDLIQERSNSASPTISEATLETAADRYTKNTRMIIGESLVIGISLIMGLFFIQKAYNLELENTRRQKNFLLSITHELKSPIAAIKLNIQTLLLRANISDQQKIELHKDIDTENQRLEKLISNLLLASRIDNEYPYNFESTDISLILDDVVKHVEQQYPKSLISTERFESSTLPIDKEAMYSLLFNIVENAAKYSHLCPDTKIEISSSINDSFFVVKVADYGVGISDHEKTMVFNQFYRIGQEETRASKGTGLGLYIAQRIVKAHQGKLTIADNTPSGTIFVISLPLKRK